MQGIPDRRDDEPYLQTQVQLITSDVVLDAALSRDDRIARLPMIKESEDPKADLRKHMDVGIVNKNTYLIRVALATGNPDEAAMIVNAVVDAYMDQHTLYHRSANKAQHKSLTEELDKLAKEILGKKNELKNLDHGAAIASQMMTRPVAAKKDDLGIPSLDVISEEQFARVVDRLFQADLDLIDAQAKLETARLARKAREARPDDQPAIAEGPKKAARRRSRSRRLPWRRSKRNGSATCSTSRRRRFKPVSRTTTPSPCRW